MKHIPFTIFSQINICADRIFLSIELKVIKIFTTIIVCQTIIAKINLVTSHSKASMLDTCYILINHIFSILSLLLRSFSLSPIRMFFMLHQMPTLLLKTVFCLHLFYSHMSMMQLTISATIIRTRIKQTLFHFSLFLSALYYINFGLSRIFISNICSILINIHSFLK